MHPPFDLTPIIRQFFPELNPVVEKYGQGHIHDSFLVSDCGFSEKAYLLQRINTEVFQNPRQLMVNIFAVCKHLANKNPDAVNLHLIPCRNGDLFFENESGFWRMAEFIQNTATYQKSPDLRHVKQAASATGRFIANLADFPADQLFVTIPDFHNTPKRYRDLLKSFEEANPQRLSNVQESLSFIRKRSAKTGILWDALQKGIIPWRVTHNDTKLDNILFDKTGGQAVCLIDLDTVMPGSPLFDFGDALRSMANSAAEDEPDLSKVLFRIPVFKAYTEGFLESTSHILTSTEVNLLHLAPWVITFENGMRFLTDYLQNDRYYKTDYADHNLVRCKTQLKLVADMEKEITRLKTIVMQITKALQ
jgi:N-acetylhexosamine 1-kinase